MGILAIRILLIPRNFFKLAFVFFLLLEGCTTWKINLNPSGDYNTAIKNAVIDFSNSSSLYKENNSFSVRIKDVEPEIIGVSILGNVNKFIITEDGKTSRLPNQYIEYKGKLFYWYDEKSASNDNITSKLNEYNLIDSVKSIAMAKIIIDDGKKGMDYYFCKGNLLKYKKIKTNHAMGNYDPPEVDCKQQ